jgi:hypothetical protein
MELILKRGVDYTPLIFKHPDLQNKKCCKVIEARTSEYTQTENLMKFPFITENLEYKKVRADRLKFNLHYFYGGILEVDNLIAILVYKNTDPEDKYVIAREGFFQENPNYLTRLKKYMNESNISSRTHLIMWSQSKMYSEFQELINPGMNDYDPNIQQTLSSEFILYQRSLIPIKTDIEHGDYVIILEKKYANYNNTPIGAIRQVKDHSGELFTTVEISGREPFYELCEVFRKTEVRLATQEEITNFLNYTTPIDESDALVPGVPDEIGDEEPEEEEDEVSSEHIDEILEEVEEEVLSTTIP